jgi:hypothetical protein
MRKFWGKKGGNERNEEDSRIKEVHLTLNEDKTRSNDGDLRCEDAIMKDKEQYGRVRNSLMKYLRGTYGEQIADRALWRVSKRIAEGYLNP